MTLPQAPASRTPRGDLPIYPFDHSKSSMEFVLDVALTSKVNKPARIEFQVEPAGWSWVVRELSCINVIRTSNTLWAD
jgi:hypothetical protein